MKKISSSMLKSLWLFAVVLAIMLANGLPLWILISVLIVLLALPLVRELTHKAAGRRTPDFYQWRGVDSIFFRKEGEE